MIRTTTIRERLSALLILSALGLNGCVSDGENGITTENGYMTEISEEENNAPIAKPQNIATDEDTAKAVTLTGSDTDGETLSYTVTVQPSHGTLSGAAPDLTYTPTADYYGSDSFKFKVNDGTVDSAEAAVTITVNSVNDMPTATVQSVTTDEDTAKAVTLTGSDTDGEMLSYTVTVQPSHGTLSGAAPDLTYTPTANYYGSDSFKFKVNDGTVDSAEATITVTVNSVNDLPIANAGSDMNITEGESIDLNGTGIDTDGTIDTWSWTLDSDSGYSAATQNITISGLATGTHTFTLTVTDNGGGEASDEVVVTVTKALSTLKKTGQTTVYYANDDGDYQTGVDHNYSRDDLNGIVTDHVTGLMWQDEPYISAEDTAYSNNTEYGKVLFWSSAINYCENLDYGGHSDWRLPTRKELQGIVKYGSISPAIDPTFVNVASGYNGSSTAYADITSRAWIVNFSSGRQGSTAQSNSIYVRCVRTGE